MMRRQLLYPRMVWGGLVGLPVIAWVPGITEWVSVGSLFLATAFPVVRNWYLNPVGASDLGYFNWLVTTPYKAGMPLPNGNALPNWQDAVVVLLLCLSMVPISWKAPEIGLAGASAIVWLVMTVFSYLTARQLLNFGPRWMAYLIVILLLMPLRIFFESGNWGEPSIIAVPLGLMAGMPAFVVACIGLKGILARYPWPDVPDKHGMVAGYTYQELFWGYSDVSQAGEPFSSLRPKAHWPRVRWSDALWLGAAGMAAAWCFTFRGVHELLFIAMCLLPVFLRYMCYFKSRPFRLYMLSFWRSDRRANAALPILILAGMIIFGNLLIYYQAVPHLEMLVVAFIGLFYISALKLPPSRREWETTGRWQLSMSPGEMARGYNRQNNQSEFKVSSSA